MRQLDIQMKRTCDAAPVQYEGTINGRAFYFRARYDEWSFGIADTVDEAVTVSELWCPDDSFFRGSTYGDSQYAASYMPHAEAERIIAECANEYISQTTAGEA